MVMPLFDVGFFFVDVSNKTKDSNDIKLIPLREFMLKYEAVTVYRFNMHAVTCVEVALSFGATSMRNFFNSF